MSEGFFFLISPPKLKAALVSFRFGCKSKKTKTKSRFNKAEFSFLHAEKKFWTGMVPHDVESQDHLFLKFWGDVVKLSKGKEHFPQVAHTLL